MKAKDMKTKNAFTLVELSLSLAIISILLIAITMVLLNVARLYTKGVTIKSVNASARSIVDDMRQTAASSTSIDTTNQATYFVNNIDPVSGTATLSGRFCTGTYSYIWNSAQDIAARQKNNANLLNQYSGLPPSTTDVFIKLVKVSDGSGEYCSNLSKQVPFNTDATVLIPHDDESDLAFYDFFVSGTSSSTQTLYSASFVLGTLKGAADASGLIPTNARDCKPPADMDSDFDYCSINKFNFAMMATGRR